MSCMVLNVYMHIKGGTPGYTLRGLDNVCTSRYEGTRRCSENLVPRYKNTHHHAGKSPFIFLA